MKKKKISVVSALMLVLGTVVGSGIFFNATAVLSNVRGNGILSIVSWIVSGIMTIAGGLTIAELGVLFPENSGLVVYLEKTFGKKIGFLAGWMQMIAYFPAVLAALSLMVGKQFTAVFHIDAKYSVIIGFVSMFVIVMLNAFRVEYGVTVQNIFTVLKFIPISLIIIFGLLYANKNTITNEFIGQTQISESVSYFGSAILTTLFAYEGWMVLGNVVGQMENPKKNLPKVLLLGLSLVTIIYVLINSVYLFVATPTELLESEIPGVLVAERLFTGFGGQLINIGILLSVIGSVNGIAMGSVAVPESLFAKNWLPYSNQLNQKSILKSLLNGLIIIIPASIMVLTGTLNILMDVVVFSVWVFIVMAFVAVFILRHTHKNIIREYKVPFYPFVPLIAIMGGGYILINTVMTNQIVVLYFVIAMLVSIPFMLIKK